MEEFPVASSGVIDPEVLDAAASGALRDAIRSHPAGLALLPSFFVPTVAERLSHFLNEEARYAREFRLFSIADHVDEERWEAAEDRDRMSTFGRVSGVEPVSALGPGALAYLQVRRELEGSGSRRFLEAAFGRPLGRAWTVEARRMLLGDFVRPHRYDLAVCRVRLEVFLSPEWQAAYGGELCVIDAQERLARGPAEYNSAVLLDVSVENTYLVSPIRYEAGNVPRISLGVCLRAPVGDAGEVDPEEGRTGPAL